MRYMKAADVLPPDLLAQVQAYIDGEYLYIPRRETSRKPWGAANGRKAETLARNQEIYRRYREGTLWTSWRKPTFWRRRAFGRSSPA